MRRLAIPIVLAAISLAGCGAGGQTAPRIHGASRFVGARYGDAANPTVGEVLSTTNGTWTNAPISYTYQWQRCSGSCTNITGATASSYTVQSSDLGDTIDVIATASNAAGSASQTSAPTGVVAAAGGGTGNFADEFSASSINTAPNGWTVFDNTLGNTPNAFQCDFATQAGETGGFLTETMSATSTSCTGNGGGTSNSKGAEVESRDFAFKYGTITARAQFTGGSGSWPAFWMIGTNCEWPTYLVAPNCNWPGVGAEEIDIDDQVQGSTPPALSSDGTFIHAACSFNPAQPTISNTATNYHVFELDWTASTVTWKVDGSQVAQSTSCSPTSPMIIVLTDQAASNTGLAFSPATSSWDYVRVTPAGPITTVNPSASGTPTSGSVLTANTGTWTPAGPSFSYQWLRCNSSGLNCSPVTSGNSCTTNTFTCSATYTLSAGDVGFEMEAVVRGSNASGATDYGSTPTAVVS